ncbi:hypothetical protein Pint_32336 [Pistacia integerrima]|uniref:Uncharacterized protein n=1 Tax=Pistacia integerrima TaxID=434235 RepID=A0ACC0XPL2_9ROSI|nr:hypothetical protein Pint_32336 [Pistacia integerrima]
MRPTNSTAASRLIFVIERKVPARKSWRNFPVSSMGLPSDDAVVIQKGKVSGDPHVITVNCPDKTGLGCDICRIILEFGLYIAKGDISTDGRWCYIVLWVVPSVWFHYCKPTCPPSSPVYLLKFFCLDRKGLLHDVTQVLCELELTIQRVKVTMTPDGRVLDLFFITDNMELLHTKQRQDETCEQLHAVLGESCISCELQLAGPEYEYNHGVSSLSPVVAEELFRSELSEKESRSQALSPDMTKLKKANVIIDNSLSPAHTLLQIHCVNHKGLLYDIMRTLKDCNMQVCICILRHNCPGFLALTRKIGLHSNIGYRDLDLFIQQKDGKKIVDPEKQSALCSRLKEEMLHPLRAIITDRGPDTELLVANPVELCGKGRPRVFYDVTLAVKVLGICIFSAEIGRYSTADREWELYRFLLDEKCRFQLSNMVAREHIVDRVRRALMGW